jgi:hypothetical protein
LIDGYQFGIFGHEHERRKRWKRERDGIRNDNDGDCWRFFGTRKEFLPNQRHNGEE